MILPDQPEPQQHTLFLATTGIPIIQQPNRIAYVFMPKILRRIGYAGSSGTITGRHIPLILSRALTGTDGLRWKPQYRKPCTAGCTGTGICCRNRCLLHTRQTLFDGIELLTPLTYRTVTPEEAGGQAQDPYHAAHRQKLTENGWFLAAAAMKKYNSRNT
jgi:hypothetical protein